MNPGLYGSCDLAVTGTDLETDSGLESAILISLLTDKGSWWADPDFGSELYQLKGQKANDETTRSVKATVEDCLAWMVNDGVAGSVTVDVERQAGLLLAIGVSVTRPDGTVVPKYVYNWEAMG